MNSFFKKVIRKFKGIVSESKDSFFKYLDFFISLIPSKIGIKIRRITFKGRIKLGKKVMIEELVSIKFPERLIIGDNSYIGRCTMIQSSGNVEIGKDVLIGPFVKIWSSNHKFDNPSININKQGHEFKKVIIEDNVWLGAGVIVLSGVTIKYGTVVAAGSIVTKNFPENSIIAGNPGRLLKSRI